MEHLVWQLLLDLLVEDKEALLDCPDIYDAVGYQPTTTISTSTSTSSSFLEV